ncbi:MAG TPA: post-transcriptional regulator [Bacillales bacterium]|nr:post-transcriptional regulator [Bacillales bacterium]
MPESGAYDHWKEKLDPIINLKVDEFVLLGYDEPDRDEIWKCAVERVHRKHGKEPVRLHVFVNEFMGLSVNDYMNRLRKESFFGPDWFEGDKPLKLSEFDEAGR